MNNIEILKKDKVFKKIINDFNIELMEKVTKIKNMDHLFNELYLAKSMHETYYICTAEKDVLNEIEQRKLPLLVFIHATYMNFFIFSTDF